MFWRPPTFWTFRLVLSSVNMVAVATKSPFAIGRPRQQASSSRLGLTLHPGGALEIHRDRVDADVVPALGVHELLPAAVVAALVVLRDVTVGDVARPLFRRARMADTHREVRR